ncbi:hypothetical protein BJ508DRAFT_95490 [Ascobolus immersus RN42]|uniref:Uncharacterized protein n=1 Tax=Ascobolus immersus RN42 TaxID=1160509 RepID=A0A3N4IQN2_ASCIM|nr:hypothetical protein BJ508DRAFT_95490 [Ascobolus immersus RN42]
MQLSQAYGCFSITVILKAGTFLTSAGFIENNSSGVDSMQIVGRIIKSVLAAMLLSPKAAPSSSNGQSFPPLPNSDIKK